MKAASTCLLFCLVAVLGHASPFTPLSWQQIVDRHANPAFIGQHKHLTWVRDQNRNFIDDAIETRFRPGDQLDVIVDLNRCLTPGQIEEAFSRFGHVSYVGKLVTFALLDKVPFTELTALAARPEVSMIELREPMHPEMDVATRAIEAHKSVTAYPGLSAEEAGLDGTGIVIAILGTGVSSGSFSQLAGKRIAGFDASDPADPGDGTTDPPDVLSFHETVMAVAAVGAGVTGQTCRTPDAGSTANCAGVAPGAKYVNVRQCATSTTCNFYPQAVDWIGINAQKFTIRIVNMSFSSCLNDDGTSAQAQQANFLVGKGLVVVAAMTHAPDTCTPQTAIGDAVIRPPGSASFAITVNASDDKTTVDRSDDTIWTNFVTGPRVDFSFTNPNILALKPDVSAPGWNLEVFKATGVNHLTGIKGTSPATALVSGAAALILQKFPQMTPDSVKQLLLSSADTSRNTAFSTSTGTWDKALGVGLVNVGGALQAATAQGTDMTFPNCTTGGVAGQPCPLANGAPAWDNEVDITTSTSPKAGVANNIIVTVKNNGANDATVLVNFGIYLFAAGNSQFFHLGTQQVTVMHGQTKTLTQSWMPAVQHSCAQVSIAYGMDSDYMNNVTQRNLQVQPSVYQVRVENPWFVSAHFDIEAKSTRPGWVCRANTLAFDLDPFRDCPRNVEITFDAPANTPPGPTAKCQVAVYGTPKGGEKKLIGGVTAQTYVPRQCTVYGHVVDVKGRSVPGARVSFTPLEHQKGAEGTSAITNAGGIFSLRITPDILQELVVQKANVGEGRLRLRNDCGLSLPLLVLNRNSLTLEFSPPEIEAGRKQSAQ